MRMLSVDWDFFFPVPNADSQLWQLYDWGHRDGGELFLNTLWYHRAAAFMHRGMALPETVGTSAFWQRFGFKPGTILYYAESHVSILAAAKRCGFGKYIPVERVVSFDAHHDGGYKSWSSEKFAERDELTCEDWGRAFIELLGVGVGVVYPKWRGFKNFALPEPSPDCKRLRRKIDDGKSLTVPFSVVFVCRSGGWTPPWCDDAFDRFIDDCPVSEKVNLDGLKNRQWKPEIAEQELRILQKALDPAVDTAPPEQLA